MEPVHNQTFSRSVEAAENVWLALDLRKKRKTYREIAKQLGVSHTQAKRYVDEALNLLRAETLESAEQLRAIEVEALNKLEAQLVERLEGNPDDQNFAKLAAALVRVSESRRKLQGLDAPQRVEVSGNTYTVREASPDCSTWSAPAAPPRLADD